MLSVDLIVVRSSPDRQYLLASLPCLHNGHLADGARTCHSGNGVVQLKMMVATTAASMGKTITTLAVTNQIDQVLAKRGLIPADGVRAVNLDQVIIDMGATTLCLPADIIDQLGLDLLKDVDVETANGVSQARIFQDAKITLMGREGTFECLELPGGRSPLFGVTPLEALGIELDLNRQTLRLLPMGPDKSYLTIY